MIMKSGIIDNLFVVFIIILSGLFVPKDCWAVSPAEAIEFDGKRLSVCAKGIPLEELLISVSKITGIEFKCDGLVRNKKIWLDLKAVPLSDAISRMVSHLNSIIVYDTSYKPVMVHVLHRDRDSKTAVDRKRDDADFDKSGPYLSLEDPLLDEVQASEDMSGQQKEVLPGPPALAFSEEPPPEDVIIN